MIKQHRIIPNQPIVLGSSFKYTTIASSGRYMLSRQKKKKSEKKCNIIKSIYNYKYKNPFICMKSMWGFNVILKIYYNSHITYKELRVV